MVITAEMAEPVVYYGDGLHLDGILAWAAYRDLKEEDRWEVPSITSDWAADFDLPLEKWHVDVDVMDPRLRDDRGVWGWCATQHLDDWERRGAHEIRKKPAGEEMGHYTTSPSINLALGPTKAWNLTVPVVFAREMKWCAVGDLDEVLRLLSTHVYGVGKHCAKGMGRVLQWTVMPSQVSVDDILSRRVVACSEDGATCVKAVRPPYHHASRHTWAREPCL